MDGGNVKVRDMRQRARELAKSGEHLDYRSIAFALENEGHPDAHATLNDERLRREPNEACDQNRTDT
jgi:hypothetical protein